MFLKSDKEIILASASPARKRMLESAGLNVTVVPGDIDEGSIIDSLDIKHVTAADMAEILARAKAEMVSARHGRAVVIGADQVLSLGNEIFSKPEHMDGARDTLLKLRGREHQLHSAVAIAEGGETRWAYVETAHLKMRDFTPHFLGQYLGHVGEAVLRSVGCYEIEGEGVHLFDEINGDSFTIQGMPLIALLNFFYDDGVLSL